MSKPTTDSDSTWDLVEHVNLKGVVVLVDENGDAVSLSARSCRDADKWEIMPSLSHISSSLRTLDLHKARYMSQIHDSVCLMRRLRTLTLTHCDRLASLPETIGDLESLEVLDLSDSSQLTHVPESIGNMKR